MPTRTAQFDLQAPEPVWGVERYSSVLLLIRAGRAVQGFVRVQLLPGQAALPVRLIQQAIGEQLGELDEGSVSDDVSWRELGISVIICTRDRPVALQSCLRSLRALQYGNYEVIVVDNASRTDETRRIVSESGFRYVREDRPGLDWARNCGAQSARYDIVAYTDDDVRVDPFWLQGIAKGFSDPDVVLVTGLICPLELEWPAQRLFEAYGGMGKGVRARLLDGSAMSSDQLLAAHNTGVGANMAYRRDVLMQSGMFDVDLDVGTPSGGAGDLDMFHRLLAAGYKAWYEPTALVWHQHRRTIPGLQKQIYNNGRSFGCYLLKVAERRTVPVAAVAGFALRVWMFRWLILSALKRQPGRNPALVLAEWWGVLNAPWAFLNTYRKLPWL